MKKTLSLLVLALLSGTGLWAQIPNGYYNNANGKTGEELKIALHDIIKGHSTISYNNIWNAFWSTDNKGNNEVWDMYSDGANYSYSYTNSDDQCGENAQYEQEGDCYNREHSWPKSWFSGNEQTIPGRDLHHIFPTDGYVNMQRGSYPYGEVKTGSSVTTFQNGSKLGYCKSSLGYSGKVFEPIDEYKGDFARAFFYMSTRYYDEDSDWGSSGMTNKSEILPWAMTMLLNWSDNDPVSQKEIDRNNAVYNIQNNRNPFIDHPEYARMIWDPDWHGGNVGNGDYVKVTSSDEIADGDYLIVCASNSVAFNGALTSLDAVGNTIDVTISGDMIASSDATDAAFFTITAKTDGYSIKSASGKYIGNINDANALKTSSTDDYVNTIAINDGNADIVSSMSHLRYNPASGQTRFRYFKSSTYTGQQAIQLYKKIVMYSITLASVENGSISADKEEALEGDTITLTATPDSGYEFDHWTVTDADNNAVTVTENQFVMPASNVTVSVVFVYVGVPFEQKYYLVTSTDELVAGRTYLIVNTGSQKALGKTQNTNNRSAAAVTIESDVISTLGDACELRLGGQVGAWTLYDATNNSGYLYAAGGNNNNNYLKTQATLTNAGKWTITLNGNKATIKTIDSNVNRHTIMYNNSNNIFSCYASNQQDVSLFIRSEEYNHTESETISNLFSFDKHTVYSGATLTVTGTATCNDANLLVIEDGGQLAHNSDNVQATLKKIIHAYNDDGGWYTLAAPFTSYAPAGTMTGDAYDLYAFDEDDTMEWVNHKQGSGFDMVAGQGYLYAHNPATMLRMTGVLNNGTYSPTIDLSYANSNANIKGFNLLGNPTAHEITFIPSENVSDGYYYLDNDEDWTYTTAGTVPVGRGFLVKANALGQTVTLNPQTQSGQRHAEGQYLCVSIGKAKVYVKLDEGGSMPSLALEGQYPELYLVRENKPYTMLVRNGAQAVNLCFEPRCNGTQTLSVNIEGLAIDYLHLIDQKTGADIDLLKTPNYTFEAQTDDSATRFKLVFGSENKK